MTHIKKVMKGIRDRTLFVDTRQSNTVCSYFLERYSFIRKFLLKKVYEKDDLVLEETIKNTFKKLFNSIPNPKPVLKVLVRLMVP